MIGCGSDRAVFHHKGVIIFAATEPCGPEADALHSGDAEDDGGNTALHAVKQRSAQSHGQTQHSTFHDAANGVTLRLGGGDLCPHGLPYGVIYHREWLVCRGNGQRSDIFHRADGGDAADDFNALLFQQLQADATGDAQGGCQPPGKRAAPGEICVTAVLHSGGIVRVAGAGHHGKAVIVPGAGVGVADDGGKRRAAGDVPHQTGKKFRLVRLLPRGGPIVAARGTAVQKRLKGRHVDGLPGRQTLQNHADGRGMGLAEDGQMQKFSVPAHRPPPFNASKSSQKWG